MKEQKRYRYLGLNGILDTTICLEDVPCTAYVRLIADDNYVLVNGNKRKYRVNIFDGEEKDEWKEIPIGQE